MKHHDINYNIGGYSVLEDVATDLIAASGASIRFVVRFVKGAFEVIVDLKDGIADLGPSKIPQRRSLRPRTGKRSLAIIELAKLRAGIF
ncbi:MAG: hypothetical protein AAF420_04610 [Pseudomonadota bacterium]